MGEERSSTWPTVTDVAVTPGEEPDVPDEPDPPVGVDAWVVVDDDDAEPFDEQAARVRTHTESRMTTPVRSANGRAGPPRRARIRTLSRFAFTKPPSVSPFPSVRPSPQGAPKLAMPTFRPVRTPMWQES